MKYISLDLETTGLDPLKDQILQISMVVEDTDHPEIPVEDLPHWTAFIKHDEINGSAYALGMNGWILDIISGRKENKTGYPIVDLYTLSDATGFIRIKKNLEVHFPYNFLNKHFDDKRITVAGKNVAGFDIPFLPKELSSRFKHKVIDPGAMFWDPSKDDQVPSLDKCLARAGIDKPVPHDAREDAMLVIEVIRAYLKGER